MITYWTSSASIPIRSRAARITCAPLRGLVVLEGAAELAERRAQSGDDNWRTSRRRLAGATGPAWSPPVGEGTARQRPRTAAAVGCGDDEAAASISPQQPRPVGRPDERPLCGDRRPDDDLARTVRSSDRYAPTVPPDPGVKSKNAAIGRPVPRRVASRPGAGYAAGPGSRPHASRRGPLPETGRWRAKRPPRRGPPGIGSPDGAGEAPGSARCRCSRRRARAGRSARRRSPLEFGDHA